MIFGNSNIIFKSKTVVVQKITIKALYENYKIENWSKNRKPDKIRIEQIKMQYANPEISQLLDGVITAWKKPGSNILYIYDGIHRLTASKDFSKNILILKTIETDDEKLIIDDFRKINLSVSIPYLFLEDNNNLKIQVCEAVMLLFCDKWPNNISPSRNPWKCNFNRDVFIDSVLSKLTLDFTIPNIDKIIFDAIIGINEQAKKYVDENSIKLYQKNTRYNFYIMYFSPEVIKTKICQSSLIN